MTAGLLLASAAVWLGQGLRPWSCYKLEGGVGHITIPHSLQYRQ
jgi:hypothetical protein